MNRFFTLALSFCVSIVFGQKTEFKINHISHVEIESHVFNVENYSDSLLCIFYSGFHGQHNSTHFTLPLIDSSNAVLNYRMDYAKQDLLMDVECKYYQVLTIKAHLNKTITIELVENLKQKRIYYYFVKSNLSEEKFIKTLPKRCLGRAFEFRQGDMLVPNN